MSGKPSQADNQAGEGKRSNVGRAVPGNVVSLKRLPEAAQPQEGKQHVHVALASNQRPLPRSYPNGLAAKTPVQSGRAGCLQCPCQLRFPTLDHHPLTD